MALFLNRHKLNYWINQLICESELELIIIVPYIQISETVYKSLVDADRKQVKITLIYRESKLSENEKIKLLNLDNLTLLHHPNIHCKCYYNGEYLIIGSMNLYEYSEKNNREMGVLLHSEYIELEEDGGYSPDDKSIFTEAISEIREIINGSRLERISKSLKETNFVIDIIKTDEEIQQELADQLNKYFYNKKFKPVEVSKNEWQCICANYYDNVDIFYDNHRIRIEPRKDEDLLKNIHSKWRSTYNEYEFKGFKFYWNYNMSCMYLYRDKRYGWESMEEQGNEEKFYRKLQQGIDLVIAKFRKLS